MDVSVAEGSMRILIAIDSLGVGGKERQAVELIKTLKRTGTDS